MTGSDVLALTAEETALLTALARVLYPHPGLDDGPYARAVAGIEVQAGADPAIAETLRAGLPGAVPDEAALREVRHEPFVRVLRPLVAQHLYDDAEVRAHLGYPGPSYELGGYLHRGFDDLDWLPAPRVEEPDEALVEIGALPYPVLDEVHP